MCVLHYGMLWHQYICQYLLKLSIKVQICSDALLCAHVHCRTRRKIMHRNNSLTHVAQIRGVFDVANSQRYRTGFAPMLFQWSHAHTARFFVAKNRAIKRGLERKNRAMCVMALRDKLLSWILYKRWVSYYEADTAENITYFRYNVQ